MSTRTKLFTKTPVSSPPRNLFDLSFEVKMSGKFGILYPMMVKETLPGDIFRNRSTVFARLAPQLSPTMHRIDIKTEYFFVANRIIWDDWENSITGGKDGTYVGAFPYVNYATLAAGSGAWSSKGTLADYMGLPTFDGIAEDSTTPISILPFRAFAKIFNDYYMDPNLGDEIVLNTELSGNVSVASNTAGLQNIRRRGWEKDFYMAILPWAQRGAEVLMPLEGDADVTYRPASNYYQQDDGVPSAGAPTFAAGATNSLLMDDTGEPTRVENIDDITITNSSVSINDLRRSMALQKWLEVNARSGHRYNEQIYGHFKTRVPDYRLQRAEYLGGGRQPVVISEVLSTADSVDVPVGDMAGHGISVGKNNSFNYRCEEHGFIIGIVSIMPRSGYSGQGLDRMWTRQDKFDYAWPELAHIGEQEVKNKEVFYRPDADQDAENEETFGYLPRYIDYKYSLDRIAGDFKTTLFFQHLNRRFLDPPALDIAFTTVLEDGGSTEESLRRIFAVQDGTDYIWMQIHHNLTAKRPLPYFGVPQ